MTSFGRHLLSPTYSLRNVGTFREFPRKPITLEPATRVDTPNGRFYLTPDRSHAYPSVTTVLGSLPKPELDAWRAAVGEDEARRVSERATRFGTRVHSLAEHYVLGTLDPETTVNDKRTYDAFSALKNALDSHLELVVGSEVSLYSPKYGIAGTCDLLCVWDGELAVVDFKTSSGVKHRSMIDGYFTQATAYSEMVEDLKGFGFDRLAIVIITLDDTEATVFTETKTVSAVNRLKEITDAYHSASNRGSRNYIDRVSGSV